MLPASEQNRDAARIRTDASSVGHGVGHGWPPLWAREEPDRPVDAAFILNRGLRYDSEG